MASYVCLHWLVPKNEMRDFHHKIPKGEVWMREDIYDNLVTFGSTKRHEETEIGLMLQGMSYKSAHKLAEIADGFW